MKFPCIKLTEGPRIPRGQRCRARGIYRVCTMPRARDRGPRLRRGDISYDYPSHRWVTKSLPRAAVDPPSALTVVVELRPYKVAHDGDP